MRKVLAVILAISIIASGILSVPVMAQSNEPVPEEQVFISDIFYAYSQHLNDPEVNTAFIDYHNESSSLFRKMTDDFYDSDDYWASYYKDAFETGTSPVDLLKELANCASQINALLGGEVDYDFDDSIDNANLFFAKHIYGNLGLSKSIEDNEKAEKLNEKVVAFKDLCEVMQKYFAENNFNADLKEELLTNILDYLDDLAIFYNIDIKALKAPILENVPKVFEAAKFIEEPWKAAISLSTAIMIEEVRLEEIKLIMDYAEEGSALKYGMTKLYNQLKGNFNTYFLHNYLDNLALEKITDAIANSLADGLLGLTEAGAAFGSAILKVSSFLVFDVGLNAVDLNDVLRQETLNAYCEEMYNIISRKAEVFEEQFNYSDYDDYVNLLSSYNDLVSATLAATEEMLIDKTRAEFEERSKSLEEITNLPDAVFDGFKEKIKTIPYDEREVNEYPNWIVSQDTYITTGSDVIEEGYVYCANGIFDGSVSVNATLSTKAEDTVTITGNINFPSMYSYVVNDGNLTVNGDIAVNKMRIYITNNGVMEIKGDLTQNISYTFFTNTGELILGGNSTFAFNPNTDGNQGSITLNGTELQEISNLSAKNLYIENPTTVKYLSNITVYEEFLLNGNTIDTNGFATILGSENAVLDSVSNYKNIGIAEGVQLQIENPVVFNHITVHGGAKLTLSGDSLIYDGIYIGGNAAFIVDADVVVGGDVTIYSGRLEIAKEKEMTIGGNINFTYMYSYVVNDGNLTVNGDIAVNKMRIYITNNGVMEIKGDLTQNVSYTFFTNTGELILGGNSNFSITDGNVNLNGDGLQTIGNLKVKELTIENSSKEGVVFNTPITVSVMFNHNGNNFTLYNGGIGSSFVDFDKDGCLDHLDVGPTTYTVLYSFKSACDVNNDKKTDLKDLVRIKKNAAQLSSDSNADITGDGKINADDILIVVHYLLNDFAFFENIAN